MKLRILKTAMIALITVISFSSCVEHRYYHEHHYHTSGWYHHHHRTPPAGVELEIHN